MNADIRIYPAAELSALDMAELMNAALLNDGILQGCGLSVSSNELHIASGRMVIKGRLAVVTAGTIERPEDVLSRQTCHVCAICDLNADTPFTIENLKQGDYDELVSRASGYTGDTFNVNNGVALLELGTTVVDPSEGVVSVAAASGLSGKNATKVNALTGDVSNIRTLVTNVKTEITNAYKAADNVINNSINYLKAYCGYNLKRAWASSKFELKWKEQTGIRILPGMTLYVYFRKEHDSVDMNYYIPFGASSDEITNYRNQARSRYNEAVANNPSKAVLMYECNQGGPASKIAYQSAATNPPSYTPAYDQYGVRTGVDTRKVAAAVSGVDLSSGTATKYAVLTTFGMNGTNLFVGLHNVSTGSDIVIINVRISVLYVQNE